MVVLGYVAMAGSLSTDLYLPAFPGIMQDLGVGASAVQLTLTAFLLGAAVGQLLIGSVSDALGRRRTLIVALTVFTLCCYLASLSPSLEALVAVRAVQGAAGAAGVVLARAIVSDLADRAAAVRAFGTLFVFIALGPAIASPLGAGLTQWGGWRMALLGLAVIATGMLLAAVLRVPETLPLASRHPLTIRALASNIGRLLRDGGYLGYAIAFAAGYGALMAYISSSSFIAQEVFGVSPLGYALIFSLSSIAIMIGAAATARVGDRIGAARTLRYAQTLVLVSAGSAAAVAAMGALTLPLYIALVFVFAVGCGAVMSTASALAVGAAVGIAGAGSAVLGFTQFVFGAASSPLGGILGTQTPVPALVAMTAFAMVALISGEVGRRVNPHSDRPLPRG
jgi:DHA1 family bicyclomycin/chloramphenicol resistance-like MFS transporter